MIIPDLEHLEIATEVKQVEGGIAQLQFTFDSLVLGANNSIAVADVDFLLTSEPSANIAGITFSFAAQAD